MYGNPLELVTLPNGLQVPANAEYAMWGRITTENDDEGPYVDITGTVDDIRLRTRYRNRWNYSQNKSDIPCLDTSRSGTQDIDGTS